MLFFTILEEADMRFTIARARNGNRSGMADGATESPDTGSMVVPLVDPDW